MVVEEIETKIASEDTSSNAKSEEQKDEAAIENGSKEGSSERPADDGGAVVDQMEVDPKMESLIETVNEADGKADEDSCKRPADDGGAQVGPANADEASPKVNNEVRKGASSDDNAQVGQTDNAEAECKDSKPKKEKTETKELHDGIGEVAMRPDAENENIDTSNNAKGLDPSDASQVNQSEPELSSDAPQAVHTDITNVARTIEEASLNPMNPVNKQAPMAT